MSTGGKVLLIVMTAVVVAVAALVLSVVVGGSGDADNSTAPQPSISSSDDSPDESASPSKAGATGASPQQPFTIGLNGTANSPPFKLSGGDYRIAWTTRSDCTYSVEMVPAIGSYGAQDLITTDKATSGDDVLRDVSAGPYFAEGVTEPAHGCAWEVTFTQLHAE